MKKFKKILCSGLIALTCGVTTMTAQVTIGAGNTPASGALLDLKQQTASPDSVTATKGLLYPRVKLTNINDLNPMFSGTTSADVKKEHIGLTVYNVTNNTVFTPGIYVWDGTSWIRPVTKLPVVATNQINAVDLNVDMTTPLGISNGETSSGQGSNTGELIFTNRDGTTNIIIPEDGSYAFSFNFYGNMNTNDFAEALKTGIYYLSLWKNNITNTANVKDIAEIDMLVAKETGGNKLVTAYTYSITMAAFFNKGDIVKFKLTMFDTNKIPWTLRAKPYAVWGGINANRTSMVWWRL